MDIKISPSMLASDYANLEAELKKCESADLIHLDVMDGHFVPNISIGAPVIKAMKRVSDVPFDVHLMISEPLKYIADFADAGADIITFHTECDSDINETINQILECGCKASLSVKPNTPIEAVYPYMDKLSMVLVMTVEPGFGGQSFMENMMPKIEKLRADFPDMFQGFRLPIYDDSLIIVPSDELPCNSFWNYTRLDFSVAMVLDFDPCHGIGVAVKCEKVLSLQPGTN